MAALRKQFCKRGHARIPENLYGRQCKACTEIKSRAYFQAHPERKLASVRKYAAKNQLKEKLRSRVRNWRIYGIKLTLPEYELKLAAQDYRCAICRKHESEFDSALAVDHNHRTGRVRGLVCKFCNTHIIKLLDDFQELLVSGRIYMKQWEPENA